MGKGSVLLVEDDGAVRQIYRRLLERDGFAVFTASNGIEAPRVFEPLASLSPSRLRAERLDLTVRDIGMPHMSRVELPKTLV